MRANPSVLAQIPRLIQVVLTDVRLDADFEHVVAAGSVRPLTDLAVAATRDGNEVVRVDPIGVWAARVAVHRGILDSDDRHARLPQDELVVVRHVPQRETGAVLDLEIEAPSVPVRVTGLRKGQG